MDIIKKIVKEIIPNNIPVVITGASSFTGAHIARAFVDAGYTVAAPLTRGLDQYREPHYAERMQYSGVTHWIENAPFGSEAFTKLLKHLEPKILVNHGAPIKNYRKPDFDIKKCVAESLVNVDSVCELMADFDGKIIHSGSLFEDDEELAAKAYSAYGEAKSTVWGKLKSAASHEGVPLHKIVIPDPVGPFENKDRLAPTFFHKWKLGNKVEVHNPEYIWDRLPAAWLAHCYIRAAADDTVLSTKVYRPSGFVENNLHWSRRLEQLFEKKSGKFSPGLETVGDATGSRANNEGVPELTQPEFTNKFFSDYGKWLMST